MTAAFDRVLASYKDRIREEAACTDKLTRDEMLLEVGEEAANLMTALIEGIGANTIVELGTSYGYSTLFLARAAEVTDGRVFTYELSQEKQEYARRQLNDAKLSHRVEWKLGDAVTLLKDQPGPVDFVFIDLWKDLYVPCFEAIYPMLSDNAIVVADNMTFPARSVEHGIKYRKVVRAKPDMEAVLLHVGNGLDVSVKKTVS